MPESIIDGYIRSDDSSIRQVVLEDNSPTIRQCSWRTIHQTCCHKLSVKAGRDETPWSIVGMTPQESDKIAVYLYQKFENTMI